MTQNSDSDALQLQWQESFKDIQCYSDDVVESKLASLSGSKALANVLSELFSKPEIPVSVDLSPLRKITSIAAFQNWVEATFFPLVSHSFSGLTLSGLEQLDASKPYLFVSNHRDIVMDPLLLNRVLREKSFSTANCAIGDNLLVHPNANDLALLNRCFKVFRSLKSPRAMLKAMKVQSEYIRFLHFTKKENIWIAQKEGRAKDNVDRTNPALIKMLGLAKPKSHTLPQYLDALKIVPVCFSYEWDPCDIDKAQELYETDLNGHYTKNKNADFISTKKGLSGYKGNIHVHFDSPLLIDDEDDHRSIADKIDKAIQNGYKYYPINFASYKKIHAKLPDSCPFSKNEINAAIKQIEDKLLGQAPSLQKLVYQAYSQVLGNE